MRIPKGWYERGRLQAWFDFKEHLEEGVVDPDGYPWKRPSINLWSQVWKDDKARLRAEKSCMKGYDEGWSHVLEIYELGKAYYEKSN
jgi:hypothetical protein